MRRRGLRLEVDEPTDWQLRNKRWLAQHPLVTSCIGAVICGALGAAFADLKHLPWLVSTLSGAALGGIFGWGFSAEHRDPPPVGATRLLYIVAAVLAVCVLIAMQAA